MKELDSLGAGTNPPEAINVVVEIPKGNSVKYEFDSGTGFLFVDRKLYTAMFYPCNYGFIPQTLEMDGDPVDALILGEDTITEDEEGQDSKVIATPIPKIDPTFSEIEDVKDIPRYIQDQIKHFFEHYKELEQGKFVRVKGWEGKQAAMNKISEAIERFEAKEAKIE